MKPVKISPYDRVLIERRIAEFLADGKSVHAESREEVARRNILPLYFGWTGFLALGLDGRIVWIGDDLPEDSAPEEERWRNIALFEGSRRYPEIQALVPVRPPDAVECPHCDGKGGPILPEIPDIRCYCGDLGWLPPGSNT